MCVDCWNAAMGLPAAAVAGRFAWVGYRDRLPFVRRRHPVAGDGSTTEDPIDPIETDAPVGPDRDDEPIGVG